jgi:hypothetical protein
MSLGRVEKRSWWSFLFGQGMSCSRRSSSSDTSDVASFVYFKVSARISKSRNFCSWRAKIFVLADDCNGYYFGDRKTSIYYEGDDLVLNILFKTEEDARKFRATLQKKSFAFSITSCVTVCEAYEKVVLHSKANEIRAVHYVHGDSDSPPHSLTQSDFKSQDDDPSEVVSIADAEDAYRICQMIEDPNNIILYNREFYRCRCESQASNKTERYNRNNVLILSWLTHQCFDGLNLATKQHLVPSIAIQFVEYEGRERLEFVSGYPFEKDKVIISIESPDPKQLESLWPLMKEGSYRVKGNILTFVQVDDWQEFKQFLTTKYEETRRLWGKNLELGAVLLSEDIPRRSKRSKTSAMV